MKKLLIYKENGEFVIERVNEFNHATKRYFVSEDGLKEGLNAYRPVIEEYQIEPTDEVWALVINLLNGLSDSNGHGGKREGAGRPSLGTTKKVSITLPDETWEQIEKAKGERTMSAFLRDIIMNGIWV